jgi:hypothetical protein
MGSGREVHFCTVFETVCASSLAMCAYQISEHLHLTFVDHLDLYSQQANPTVSRIEEQRKIIKNNEEKNPKLLCVDTMLACRLCLIHIINKVLQAG